MKRLICLLLVAFAFLSFDKGKRPYGPQYRIVSDNFDSTIKSGICIIEGFVIDQSGKIISGATVSNVSRTVYVLTDSSGKFEFELSEADSSIFMFHQRYGEIVIRDYDFKSQHRVVIHFNPRSPFSENQTVKKPVIYIYNPEPINVSVTLNHPGITFMYPSYTNGWNVRTGENGNLVDIKNGRQYPYLFWEATTTNLHYEKNKNGVEGFFIPTDTLVNFLETILTQAGLNEKEQTDFITFWAPELIKTPYVFIQFLVDEAYNLNVAPIAVNPAPDSQRRLFMLYTPITDPDAFPYEVSVQKMPPFIRSGLTLVEWGGAMIAFEDVY